MSASELLTRVYFVHLDIENANVYVNSSNQSLYWNSQEWLGVGQLGGMSNISEDTEMSASQMSLVINDVPLNAIDDLDDKIYQERPVNVYEADLDDNYQVVSSVLVWAGEMDTAEIETGDTGKITMNCESLLARWNSSEPRRMNDQTQQRLYPGSRGLQYVAALAKVSIKI